MTPSDISIVGLTKVYQNGIVALDDISLELTVGITAIIGPNGSGKTTLLKIIMGLLHPTEGHVEVYGLNCWRESTRLKEDIRLMSENPRYPPGIKVHRYLSYLNYFYESNTEFRELENSIQLPDIEIDNLSSGMKKKLGLLQAFCGKPSLIILDEPTANLDPKMRSDLLAIIKELHWKHGIKFLIASHILADLEEIATDIIVIHEGKIRFVNTFGEFKRFFGSQFFEFHLTEKAEAWSIELEMLDVVGRTEVYEDKLLVFLKTPMSLKGFLSLLYQSNALPESDFNLIRRPISIDDIFDPKEERIETEDDGI